jgi:hypothetical protein
MEDERAKKGDGGPALDGDCCGSLPFFACSPPSGMRRAALSATDVGVGRHGAKAKSIIRNT